VSSAASTAASYGDVIGIVGLVILAIVLLCIIVGLADALRKK
jgi:hypothetical protein